MNTTSAARASSAVSTAAGSRRRLLIVVSHVVQYSTPIYRQLALDPRFDLLVAFCSMDGAESTFDPGFGVAVKWDTPLLDGYPWVHVRNRGVKTRSLFYCHNLVSLQSNLGHTLIKILLLKNRFILCVNFQRPSND